MRLSRAGWNNVLIFSILAFILLINFSNQRLFPSSNPLVDEARGEQAILGEHAVILSLTIEKTLTIERVAQSWRVKEGHSPAGDTVLNAQQLSDMMQIWHTSKGLVQAADIEVSGIEAIKVEVLIAQQELPLELQLYPLNDQLLIFNATKHLWLSLPISKYSHLIPFALN